MILCLLGFSFLGFACCGFVIQFLLICVTLRLICGLEVYLFNSYCLAWFVLFGLVWVCFEVFVHYLLRRVCWLAGVDCAGCCLCRFAVCWFEL